MGRLRAVASATGAQESGKPALRAISDILGFHIRLAHGAVYRHFVETFAHLDLTQKQVAVLWLTDDNPGIAQTDLARQLRMDRATTMGVVNRLQARGYLERGRSETDRRRQSLSLTEAGRAALREAHDAVLEDEKWLRGRFTEREAATLMTLLERIHE